MISYLRGKLVQKSPTEIIVEVDGVGYQVLIPLSTFEKLSNTEDTVKILTYMHVREDAMQLYGFASENERELFRLLITISGIGPKMAQGILSGLDPAELREAIQAGDTQALTSISGVGKKTAERIILELKSKLARPDSREIPAPPGSQQLKTRTEALIALMSLGYTRTNAESALRMVTGDARGKELTAEELIKRALHHTTRSS